jgi:uncharacterized protein YbaP (TraB family)
MKKSILLLIALALALNTTKAQTKSNNSLLWEVSGNGLTSPSYLFGTYHFAAKSLVDSLSGIKTYFNNCKTVVGELLMADSTDMKSLTAAMMLSDGNTLEKIYTPKEYKLIGDYVKQVTKMDIRGLNGLKPLAVQLMLMAYTMPKTFSDTNPSIDQYFQQEGKRQNDKLLGFETMAEQTALLFDSSIDEQKKALLDGIRKADEGKKDGEKLYALYLQQDLDGLEKMITVAFKKTKKPELSDKMLKDRNLKWITKIPAIIAEQPTFIAVGAAHLVGQYGLINQLRLKGYTVKPVKI